MHNKERRITSVENYSTLTFEGYIEPLDEKLGKRVREVWIEWAKEQPNPKESWLVPWEQLSEPDKDVDRRIGIAIWKIVYLQWHKDINLYKGKYYICTTEQC